MMQINVSAIDTKNYKFVYEQEVLGVLKYQSYFSIAATIILTDTNIFDIKRRKLLDHFVEVYHNKELLYTCDITHKGGITIEGEHQKYQLKKKETLSNIYILVNKEQESLLEIEPSFNLKKISREFTIHSHSKKMSKQEIYLLPFIAIHCVNQSLSSQMGAGNIS